MNRAFAKTPGGPIHVLSVGSLTSKTRCVILTAAFADAGTLAATSTSVTITPSRGTMKVDFAKAIPLVHAMVAELATLVDPTTCGMSSTYTATYPVVRGTGSYSAISGSVRLTTNDTGVFSELKTGKCNLGNNSAPIGSLSIARGSGTVAFE